MANFNEFAVYNIQCNYYDLSTVTRERFSNSNLHLNVRSLLHKVGEIDALLNLLGLPKVLMLSETWLEVYSPVLEINNYTFVSSPRRFSRGGGVGMYLHKSLRYIIKDKSCDQTIQYCNIDYLVIELLNLNIALCCLYCPPNTKVADIITVIEHIKSLLNSQASLLIGGDFNINFLDNGINADFLDNIHALIKLTSSYLTSYESY